MTTPPDSTPVHIARPLATRRHHSALSWTLWWCWWLFWCLCTIGLCTPFMVRSYRKRTMTMITRSM